MAHKHLFDLSILSKAPEPLSADWSWCSHTAWRWVDHTPASFMRSQRRARHTLWFQSQFRLTIWHNQAREHNRNLYRNQIGPARGRVLIRAPRPVRMGSLTSN